MTATEVSEKLSASIFRVARKKYGGCKLLRKIVDNYEPTQCHIPVLLSCKYGAGEDSRL
jgi:hypothetical protein